MKTVPEQYKVHETLEDAYLRGWNHGHGIACHNVPEMGTRVWVEDMGRLEVTPENIRDVHQSYCFSAESNSRQFSPFEFTAHDLNSLDEDDEEEPTSEEAWEAFEEGVRDAIFADLSTYGDEDYGIEQEDEAAIPAGPNTDWGGYGILAPEMRGRAV